MSAEAPEDDEVILGNGDEMAPLKQLVHQQSHVIDVMRDRITELEMELINARCALVSASHTH